MNEKQRQINHATRQMKVHEMYAMYWHAQIVSGAYKFRKIYKSRELTEKQRKEAYSLKNDQEMWDALWDEKSDEEKLQNALSCMNAHIKHLNDCHDFIGSME